MIISKLKKDGQIYFSSYHDVSINDPYYKNFHYCPTDLNTTWKPRVGWAALDALQSRLWTIAVLHRVHAGLWRACTRLQRVIRPLVDLDRQVYVESRADLAEAANRIGGSKTTYAIVKSLGSRPRPPAALNLISAPRIRHRQSVPGKA